MLEPFSRLEQAWRDTLIHKAEGDAFDALAEMFNLARPYNWSEAPWREALHAVVYGPRGTPGSMFAFLDAALQEYRTEVAVTIDAAAPQTITSAAPFDGSLVGKLVRLDGIAEGLYCTVGPHTATGGASTTLTLCEWPCGYWYGADWAGLDWPPATSTAALTATFLPFQLREPTPGPEVEPNELLACKLIILLSGGVANVPPTYLQPAGGGARPVGQPFGGHVMTSALTHEGDQVNGPFPIYLMGDSLLGVLETRLKTLLAAGVHPRTMLGA
jgi:hypothetical protein